MNPHDSANTMHTDNTPDDFDLDAAMDDLVDREIALSALPSHGGPPAGTLTRAAPPSVSSAAVAHEPGSVPGADAELVASFEVGDSVELSEHLERDLRGSPPVPLVHADGSFWRYDALAGAFAAMRPDVVRAIVTGYSRMPVGTGKAVRPLKVSGGLIDDAIEICASRLRARAPDFFREAVPGIAFRNGFLAYAHGELTLVPHSPEHRARHPLPFDYQPDAPAERWAKFLREVFPPILDDEDELLDDGARRAEPIDDGADRAKLLQEFVGACLFGEATRYAMAMVLPGEGSNGKSVFMKVVSAPFPKDAVVSIAPQRLGKPAYLADLAGKRLNVVPEVPPREIADSDIFKAVVAGDPVSADRKYEPVFTFVPCAGHLLACNKLPASRDHTEGFWRRFAVVKFNATFVEGAKDTKLAERLIAGELPGIVAWMVEGAKRVFAAGRYTMPVSSVQAKKDWQADADQVQEFVEECVERQDPDVRDSRSNRTPVNAIPARDLYTIYQYWALRSGHHAVSNKEFGRRVKRFLRHGRNETTRYYVGRLTAEGQRFTIPNETPKFLTKASADTNNNIADDSGAKAPNTPSR